MASATSEFLNAVEYRPMKPKELGLFVLDVQRLGFNDFRKKRIMEAVWPFCCAAALNYCKKYRVYDIREFSGAAWLAIYSAINGYSINDGSFLLYLGFHLRAQYNSVVNRNYTSYRYSGDKHPLQFISLETPIDKDGELKIIDTVKDDSTIEEIENRETINDVNKMLSTVNEKEAEFIRDVFGFGGCCIDLETMGKRSGRTKEWARQKRNGILQKLKEQKEQKQNEQRRI